MMNYDADIPLIIFAKAPIPGRVKTRLQPQLTAKQCAEVAQILLQVTIDKALEFWPGEVILSAALDASDPFLKNLTKHHQLRIEKQAEGDLGLRMHQTMQQFGYPCAIIGSDIPQISEDALQTAYAHLRNSRNVLGPSDDGGYYLIGLSQSHPEIFEGMLWGSDTVLEQTLEKARLMSLQLQQLITINDVDTWHDLNAAANDVPLLKDYLDSL